MKYSLKNRPDIFLDEEIPIDAPLMEAWFEGFEKELQQKLKFQSKYHGTDTYGMKIIKEILGK